MATDRNGREISVGDVVAIPCEVKEITDGVQHHLVLETLYPMPDGAPNRLALNEQQVFKAEHPDEHDARQARDEERAARIAESNARDEKMLKERLEQASAHAGDPDPGDVSTGDSTGDPSKS